MDTALLCASSLVGDLPLSQLLRVAVAIGGALHVTLQADNDFYSQADHLAARGLPLNTTSLASLPAHLPCPSGTSLW